MVPYPYLQLTRTLPHAKHPRQTAGGRAGSAGCAVADVWGVPYLRAPVDLDACLIQRIHRVGLQQSADAATSVRDSQAHTATYRPSHRGAGHERLR
jgi:hypothetical protein